MSVSQARFVHIVATIGGLLAVLAWQLLPQTALPSAAITNCTTARPGNSDSEEQTMLSLMNAYRAQNGAAALTPSASLGRSALWKSTDMALNHYFAHDDLTRSFQQRLQDCGYSSTYDGENIAEGYADARETLQQWENSPEHNQNLLNPSYHAVGVGRAQAAAGQWYWTTDFGAVPDPASTTSSVAAQTSPLTPPAPPPPPSTAANLSIGETVQVNTPNDCLRARTAPSLAAPAPTCVPDGTSLTLVAGPVSADGYIWWSASGVGWVAGQYLRPPS